LHRSSTFESRIGYHTHVFCFWNTRILTYSISAYAYPWTFVLNFNIRFTPPSGAETKLNAVHNYTVSQKRPTFDLL